MRGTNGIGCVLLPEQCRVLQQSRMHVFKRGQQRGAIRGTGQDHHHHAAAQNPQHHFAHARLGYFP